MFRACPAGSAYDPADKPGLAGFAADLSDEGAGNLNSRAFHGALAERAIRWRVQTERDYMVVTVTSLKENLPEALHLLQLALTHPRFDNRRSSTVSTATSEAPRSLQPTPTSWSSRPGNGSGLLIWCWRRATARSHPCAGEA